MSISLGAAGRLRGLLALGPKRGDIAYSPDERRRVLEAVTQLTGLLESEVPVNAVAAGTAGAHCRGIDDWRSFPHIDGLDYYGECRAAGPPAREFFDFVPLRNRCLGASLGSISGTALGSTIIQSGLQAFLRGATATSPEDIARVVKELNRAIYGIAAAPDGFYATLFHAFIDPERGELHYVNAGHEPALLIRGRADRVHRLESTGTVIGLTCRASYGRRALRLEAGDVLVAFSDGIAEACGPGGREFGAAGIREVVRRNRGASAPALAGSILQAVDAWRARSQPTADRTVVVVRFVGPVEARVFEERAADLAFAAA